MTDKPDFKAEAKGCVNPFLLAALTERQEQYLFHGVIRWGLVEQHITESVATALQSAYEAGAADMKERCAGIAEDLGLDRWSIASAIRSQKP